MRTLGQLEICVNTFDGKGRHLTKMVKLPAGTRLVWRYVRGEKVLLVCGSSWFFVASNEWIEKNVRDE